MNVQTLFPPEHRTPPLPLVSLFGSPECHKCVSDYFVQILRPPLVSLSAAEPIDGSLAKYFGHGKHTLTSQPPAGILKADWFNKHRGRQPAVAIAFVLSMVHMLKTIRDATQQSGAGMVVAVLQGATTSTVELLAERVTGLCHNLQLDPRQLVPVTFCHAGAAPDDPSRFQRDSTFKALGHVVHEQCAGYYMRQARHVSSKHAEREAAEQEQPCPPEINARTAFKIAVFVKFRLDWREAVEKY
eukprot:gene13771-19679_t